MLKELPKVGDKVRYLGGRGSTAVIEYYERLSDLEVGSVYEVVEIHENTCRGSDIAVIKLSNGVWFIYGEHHPLGSDLHRYELVEEKDASPSHSDLIANLALRLSKLEAQVSGKSEQSKPLKIALCGRMRAGKDTVADLLREHHGFTRQYAFGDKLKEIAHATFPDAVQAHRKPRELYQFMNVMRDFDDGVWIKHVDRAIAEDNDAGKAGNIVITDIRQQNELDYARRNGFIIVRVEALNHIRYERIRGAGEPTTVQELDHETEHAVDALEVDYTLTNNGTLNALRAQVDALIGYNVLGGR